MKPDGEIAAADSSIGGSVGSPTSRLDAEITCPAEREIGSLSESVGEGDSISACLDARKVATVRVEWSDLHGLARGHRLATRRFLEGRHAGFGFSSAALEMDLQGETTRPDGKAKLDGWPTCYAVPILETALLYPLEPSTAQVLAEPRDNRGETVSYGPRAVLRRIIDRLAERSLRMRTGMEFEFYLMRPDGSPLGPGRQAYRMRCGPEEETFREALQGLLGKMGFGVETAILEDGPAQFEITFRPGPPLVVADAAFRVRNLIKEAATGLGLLATFLSKPLNGEAGSGLHLHQQLLDENGDSLFDDNADPLGMSDRMRWFIAGQLDLLAPACAIYLPTVNAYKRIRSREQGPLTATWGGDNRTAALRVVGQGSSLRVENRVPGGESNPYLVMATAIASGLHGIDHRLDPPPMLHGSAYAQSRVYPSLPTRLLESLRALEESEEMAEWLGREMVERFIHLKQGEEERFERYVTDWERREYFEYL